MTGKEVFELREGASSERMGRPGWFRSISISDQADHGIAGGDFPRQEFDDLFFGQIEDILEDRLVVAFLERLADQGSVALQFRADGANEDWCIGPRNPWKKLLIGIRLSL